ncbi:hypothetical protein C1N81_03575 (plasmid) [Streptomyces sp. SGAir0957]
MGRHHTGLVSEIAVANGQGDLRGHRDLGPRVRHGHPGPVGARPGGRLRGAGAGRQALETLEGDGPAAAVDGLLCSRLRDALGQFGGGRRVRRGAVRVGA